MKYVIKNAEMVNVSGDTEENQITSTTWSLALEVIEKDLEMKVNTFQEPLKRDLVFDNVFGKTIDKSNDMLLFYVFIHIVE